MLKNLTLILFFQISLYSSENDPIGKKLQTFLAIEKCEKHVLDKFWEERLQCKRGDNSCINNTAGNYWFNINQCHRKHMQLLQEYYNWLYGLKS